MKQQRQLNIDDRQHRGLNAKDAVLERCTRSSRAPALASVLVLGCFAVLFYFGQKDQQPAMSNLEKVAAVPAIDWASYEGCSVSFAPPPPKAPGSWDTKALWGPQYPASLSDQVMKNLVEAVTGIPGSVKSFYAKSRGGIKNCQGGGTETVVCMLVHPSIKLSPPPDDTKWTTTKNERLMYIIRNPRTAMPAHHTVKAMLYYGSKGQVPEGEWRTLRDEWFDEMFDNWKETLRAWKNLEKYNLELYMVHERLMDPGRGPELVRRLTTLIRDGGFSTLLTQSATPDEDLRCIWYRAVGGRPALEQYQKHGYEYFDREYVPGYNESQKDSLIEGLVALQEEYKADTELVEILEEYVQDIRENALEATTTTTKTTKGS